MSSPRRALLLNPPTFSRLDFSREGRCMQRRNIWSFTWPPLTLALGAAMLRRAGWTVEIFDGSAGGDPRRERREAFGDYLERFQPDLIIANTGTPSIESDLAIADLARQRLPEVKVGFFGIHAGYFDRAILERRPAVDFIIRGEPEFTIEALAGAEGRFEGIAGITYRAGDEIQRNPDRPMAEDLSTLPFPAWDLTETGAYRLPDTGHPFLMVGTVRGCPYKCIFCHTQAFYGRRTRARPPAAIVEEVQQGIRDYGIKDYLFWSEFFTADRAYVLEVCRLLIRETPGIRWMTSSRVDYVDADLLAMMKRAGCRLMAYGFESADEGVLDAGQKKSTLDEGREAIRLTHEAGIEVAGHFVLGLPGESRATAEKTIRFAVRSGVDYAQFYCVVPFPGSPLYETALEKGWLKPGAPWEQFDQSRSVLNYPGGLQAGEVERLRREAYRRFYLRPRVLVKAARKLGGWGQIRQWARLAANFT